MKVPFYVESHNGHDTREVDEDKVNEEIETQLKDGKWVTVEKDDGTTKIITNKKEIEGLNNDQKEEDWSGLGGRGHGGNPVKVKSVIKSATATNKMKGG